MSPLDDLDRQLIARLRADSRESVSSLANALHVARGTAQSRLNRLLRDGVIRRFTIDVDPDIEAQAIRAVTTIQLTGSTARAAQRGLGRIPAIESLHTTNGTWDLVAQLRAGTLSDLDDALSAIRSVTGVSNTETSILLKPL